MSKHPAGPWAYKKEIQTRYDAETGLPRTWTYHWIHAANGSRVANSLEMTMINAPSDEESAVARLIAASPEMLNMLQELHARMLADVAGGCGCDGEYEDGRLVGHACTFHRIERELEELLLKATGGKKS